MKFNCEPKKPCSLKEYLADNADFDKDPLDTIIEETKVERSGCVVIESEKSHVLCLAKSSALESFEEAVGVANEIAIALEEI